MANTAAAAEGATRPESLRQTDRRRGLTLERGAAGAHRRGLSSQVTGRRGDRRQKILLPPLLHFRNRFMSNLQNNYIPVFDHSAQPNAGRMPEWIRVSLADNTRYRQTAVQLRGDRLHTVCEEARCPNRGECWSRGTATFLLLGDTCTRACGFCAVKTGRPPAMDEREAEQVADAVAVLRLQYVVLTSVNRDDLPDGGADLFARTITELRRRNQTVGIELLTPDFYRCQQYAVNRIATAAQRSPITGDNTVNLVWGHNIETVPRLYKTVRKGSDYRRSLALLEQAARLPDTETKSSLMLGLGETHDEVLQVLKDLRSAGVKRLALGQYLRPTRYHLPVQEYITPQQFSDYEKEAGTLGFTWIKAGAMVRSSYHAEAKS